MSHVNLNSFSGTPYTAPKPTDGRFRVVTNPFKENYADIIVNSHLVYSGQIENGYAHGQGTYDFCDGLFYKGAFANGFAEGQGVLSFPKEGSCFVGHFLRGKAIGNGKLYYGNGTIYEGEFNHDVKSRLPIPQGYGVLRYREGSSYEGLFRDGVPHNRGLYIDPNGKHYSGEFLYYLEKHDAPISVDVLNPLQVQIWRKKNIYIGVFDNIY